MEGFYCGGSYLFLPKKKEREENATCVAYHCWHETRTWLPSSPHPREKERNDVLRAKNPKINVRYLEAKRLRRMSFDVWIYNLQLEYIIYLYILRFLKQSCHGFHHCHFQCLRLEYCCFT